MIENDQEDLFSVAEKRLPLSKHHRSVPERVLVRLARRGEKLVALLSRRVDGLRLCEQHWRVSERALVWAARGLEVLVASFSRFVDALRFREDKG